MVQYEDKGDTSDMMTNDELRKRMEREDRKEWFIAGSIAFASVILGIFVVLKAIEQGISSLTMFFTVVLCVAIVLFLSRYVLVNKEGTE